MRFFLLSGLVTLFLLLDHLFMLHDDIFERYLGLSEGPIYAAYFLMLAGYFYSIRQFVLRTDYVLLVLACSMFGMSIVCDLTLPQQGNAIVIEDGFKFLGIVTWLLYFARSAYQQVTADLPSSVVTSAAQAQKSEKRHAPAYQTGPAPAAH